MKKVLLILMALLCMTASCTPKKPSGETTENPPMEDGPRDGFFLKGKVLAIDEHIEVEVIESDYAYGVYWVLVSDATVYEDASGESVSKDAITVGDTVEIAYGGQVMMSYPPKIVAARIRLSAQ